MAYTKANTYVFIGLVFFLLLVIYSDTKVSAHGSSTPIREVKPAEIDNIEKKNYGKSLSWTKMLPTIGRSIGSGVHFSAKGAQRAGSGSGARAGSGSGSGSASGSHPRVAEVDMEKTNYGKTLSWSTSMEIRACKMAPTMCRSVGSGARSGSAGARAGSGSGSGSGSGTGSGSHPRLTHP